MLKAAIVGCGKIADSHAQALQRIEQCEIVGVCDRERLMAHQLAARFPIKKCFSDIAELLRESRPDVVHITTPPQTHFDIAKLCLNAGSHLYVEKPFTLCAQDAEALIILANKLGLRVTVGHDDQFRHVARRMRSLIQSGYLGDGPVHMESYYCYRIGQSDYASAILGDPKHWVRQLPGRLLHNVISHGIARIAEHLVTESPHVIAYGFVSPLLKSLGERDIVDELRVIISEEERTTAYFTFSSQMRPDLHQFRIHGTKNGLILDQDQETLVKLRGKRLLSFAEKFVPPIDIGAQYIGNVKKNLLTFLSNDFHMKSGMKYLIESFYKSITQGTPLPIPYSEILRTARIMDSIFAQLGDKEHNCKHVHEHDLTSFRN